LKRCFDISVAAPALLLISPFLLLAIIAIRLETRGNPLFIQTRVGKDGKPFNIIKLRTFYRDKFGIFKDEEIRSGDSRVTKVGDYLRRFKLDELPQLLCVLAGTMSLVGPRPDIPEQVENYADYEKGRLAVHPGLTGLAQVSGNTWLTWPQRIILDRWYIQKRTMRLDILIIAHTVKVIVYGETIDQDPFSLHDRLLPGMSSKARRSSQQSDELCP